MAGNGNSGNRTSSNPMVSNRMENVDPQDNSRRIEYLNAVRKLPDVDLSDAGAVEERVDLFFEMCSDYGMTPLVGNLAANLGMNRSYMWKLVHGVDSGKRLGVTNETLVTIKKAYAFIDVNYEQALVTAKNPVPWIFLGKATLDWKEQNETVITHKTESPRLQGGSREEIASRYIELTESGEATYELPSGEEEE